jgi:hypothetical protein
MDGYEQPEAAQPEMSAEQLRKMGNKWLDRIRAAEKREQDWRDDAEGAEKAYLADRNSKAEGTIYDFNILHSNIETIVPAVYNSTPIPDVRERFRSGAETPETKAAMDVAQIIERAIAVQADDGALETELEDLTQDALLAGRGVIRLRFDADEQQVPGPPVPMIDEATGLPVLDPMTGQPVMQPGQPQIVMVNERLAFEAVSWHDYREGPAARWRDMPWVAFRHSIPWEEVQKIQDPELKKILAAGGTEGEAEPDKDSDTLIWEIWCRESARVYMIVAASGEMLSITDDPLGLKDFFPMPQPVQPIRVTGSRTPVVPFAIYKRLADELETLTKRICAITDGLKVRGIIAGSADDLQRLAEAEDNTLVPIANLEGFAAAGGMDKAIAWWPVDKAIQVLRELYVSREQTKAMIYEVTGISDIVRGQGNANETATAQEIKSQWGSLRIRKLQRQIERCARDAFVIAAELICGKFSPETLSRMTQIEITPDMMELLQRPLDMYRIDVESDSTVRADLSRRKGEMGEFLQGTASFFATMAPVVQSAPQLAAPVADIYASFARQFNLGKQAEDSLEAMAAMAKQQAEQPQPPSPEQMKAEADAKIAQDKMQIEMGKLQNQMDKLLADQQIAAEKLKLDRDRLTLDERKAEIEALAVLANSDREDDDNGRSDT